MCCVSFKGQCRLQALWLAYKPDGFMKFFFATNGLWGYRLFGYGLVRSHFLVTLFSKTDKWIGFIVLDLITNITATDAI